MIGIVTDSSSDLPPDLVAASGVTVVPLSIRFGAQEFTDGVDLSPTSFWQRLVASDRLPETAAPSAGAFADAYQALAVDGCEGVVAVTLSSQMSATYQAAVIGAEAVSIPVSVVDSGTVSMALGWSVLAAAAAAGGGASRTEAADEAKRASGSSHLVAVLDTLDFLRRGGRIGSAQALVGGLLDIKPLITVKNGVVEPAGRVRTRSKALAALVQRLDDRVPENVAVLHTGDGGHAPLMEVLTSRGLTATECLLGAVVGTHTGPGTLAIAFVD